MTITIRYLVLGEDEGFVLDGEVPVTETKSTTTTTAVYGPKTAGNLKRMDNQVFREKMVLIAGTMSIGASAAIYLTALAAASPNLSQSEGMAYGIPLLMVNVLAIVNIGILCCFSGGTKQPLVCRAILALAIACLLLVFAIALSNSGA